MMETTMHKMVVAQIVKLKLAGIAQVELILRQVFVFLSAEME